MADNKDFQIGNKAKDLLIYTNTVTKPVSEKTLESKDVLQTMLKLAEMPPEQVQKYCTETAERLRKINSKQGFPKSTVYTYIKYLRETALDIVDTIQSANDCRFDTEYEERLKFIDHVLKCCNRMLVLINVSLELGYINMNRCKNWTKMVTDVKYMTLSWKKKDSARAATLQKAAEKADADNLAHVIANALKEVNR